MAGSDPYEPSAEVIEGFFNPSSIALVGVSARDGGPYRAGGRAVLDHLRTYGYAGELWPVHPKAEEIDGAPAYPSLKEVPGAPDCVVVAVAAHQVLDVLADCADVGGNRALLLSGGFGELGPEGSRLEEEILLFAREHGIRLVGPNSTGLIDVRRKVAMSMTSVLTGGASLESGSLALVVQSGAIGSSIVERARVNGIGISHFASVGNQLDVEVGSFLEYFAADPGVGSAALYVESVRDRAALAQGVSSMTAAGKPVVAILGGRTAVGEQAAASHTGKVLGRGALERALMRSLGVVLVDDPDDLWRVGAQMAERRGAAGSRRWAVMSFSGGMGVLTADCLEGTAVELARFSDETAAKLKALLPAYVQVGNPLDIGSGAMPGAFGELLHAVVQDPGVDGVCLPMPMGAEGWESPIVEAVLESSIHGKPILVGWYGGPALEPHLRRLRDHGIVTVETPMQLARLMDALASSDDSPPQPSAVKAPDPSEGSASIGGHAALLALQEEGLDVAHIVRADSEDDLAGASASLTFPVVLKSANEDIAHRLELGLIEVGIADGDDLLRAAKEMRSRYEDRVGRGAATRPLTFQVQEQISGDHEVVLVARHAGSLGWFGGVGFGGSLVEVLEDVVYVPLPCSPESLSRAVQGMRLAPLWSGHRGLPPVSSDWVSTTLNQLSAAAARRGWSEIEVNPAIVGTGGGVIVDALAVPAAPARP